MAVFVIGFVLVFVCVPVLLTWAALSVTRVRVNWRIRLLLTAVVAYLVWQHFQLPPEETGLGYLKAHPNFQAPAPQN